MRSANSHHFQCAYTCAGRLEPEFSRALTQVVATNARGIPCYGWKMDLQRTCAASALMALVARAQRKQSGLPCVENRIHHGRFLDKVVFGERRVAYTTKFTRNLRCYNEEIHFGSCDRLLSYSSIVKLYSLVSGFISVTGAPAKACMSTLPSSSRSASILIPTSSS